MLPVTGSDHLGNIHITLVGNDAFGVIVQFLFSGRNVGFDMLHGVRRNLQLFQHLVVPLKHFDGIPALLFLRQTVDNGFLNMCQCVFHRAGEGVLRNGLAGLCRLDRGFGRLHNAGTFQGGNLHYAAAELFCQVSRIQPVAVFLHDIHHVNGYYHGNSEFHQLGGQVQIALEIGTVNDIQDRVRPFIDQVIPGHHFFQRIGGKAVNARQVRDRHTVMFLQPAFLLLHSDAGPVSDKLV